ncbi:MAG: CPBP family intramembrane metalloprotease [Spirochaetales bacterium]|nr:CPBP family intramembrane metalloprotease [Spirochaetales bacterium]
MFKKTILLFTAIFCFTMLFPETSSCAETLSVIEESTVPDLLDDSAGLNNADDATASGEEGLSHFEVIFPPTISSILAGIFMLEDVFFYLIDWGNTEIWVKRGTLFSIHVPLYFVSPCKALLITGISAGCFTVYELLQDQDADFFRDFFFTGIFQAALYSTYLSYKENRIKARSGIYNDDWRQETFAAMLAGDLGELGDVYEVWEPYTLLDLITSPFMPENLFDPMVCLLPLAGISPLFTRNHDSAPWTTGEMYIGTWKMSPFAAIPFMLAFFALESGIVSISEESHFRGFIYEEIGSNFGHISAKIFDCVYFPAIHISQEVFISDYDALTITRNFLSRALLTFYMDFLYDRGGLKRTVAAHFWIDYSLLFMQWLLVSGEPQDDVSSIMRIIPELQIRIPLNY